MKTYIRIIHTPTGITVYGRQWERSMHKLRSRLVKQIRSLVWAKSQGIEPSCDIVRDYTVDTLENMGDGLYLDLSCNVIPNLGDGETIISHALKTQQESK